MLGQGLRDCGTRDVSHLGEVVKSVRTGIEIVVLQLIGGRMSACGVVDFIETVDIVDVDLNVVDLNVVDLNVVNLNDRPGHRAAGRGTRALLRSRLARQHPDHGYDQDWDNGDDPPHAFPSVMYIQ